MKISQELEKISKLVKPTKTVDFILPLTGFSKKSFQPYLVNAYLGDVDFPDEDKDFLDIFILLKYSKDISYYNLEKELEKDEYFKTSYSLFNGSYIMFVFILNPKFEKDFNKFLKGKYSELSQPAKIHIMRDRSSTSPLPFILRKDKEYRKCLENKLNAVLPPDSEVWSIMEYDKELFDREEFKELMSIPNLPLSLMR